MKTGKVVVSAALVAALVVAFFAVPLPVSRVRQTALVQLQDRAETPVLLRESGRLEELKVRDGQFVEKDEILAVFTSPDLDRKEREARAQYTQFRRQAESYERQLNDSGKSAAQLLELGTRLATAAAQRDVYGRQIEVIEGQKRTLVVRAPRAGYVINPPHVDEVGKSYDITQQPAPFCTIGDPEKLRVLMPVRPSDYHLLVGDRDALAERQRELEVVIRVRGRDEHTWQGLWVPNSLPQSEAKTIPLPLSNKGGGPIQVKPSADQNQLIPMDQQYLLSFDIDKPDRAIAPGALAQVKINCRWRSLAWLVWREINDKFNLGWG